MLLNKGIRIIQQQDFGLKGIPFARILLTEN